MNYIQFKYIILNSKYFACKSYLTILAKTFLMRLLLFFAFLSLSITAQNQYPRDFFCFPLDIPMQISGNFGELRPNHFHAGFDFKTQKKEGLEVFAAADGYVSRIKISNFGYGKAIYITHNNGFTTVYGHLKMASNMLEPYIKKNQYISKSYEIELFPAPTDFIVKQGDVIAYSGNTGGSDGPHLHFEIRDTKTEKIINPLFFGFDDLFRDTKKPVLSNLMVYPLTDETVVNQSKNPIMLTFSQVEEGVFQAEKVFTSGKIGFGINVFDGYDYSWDKNGVFSVATFLNAKPILNYQFDTFSFDETKHINALIDYPRYKKTNQRFQKLFVRNKFPLSILNVNESNGIITAQPNLTQVYRIEISDFNQNKTVVSIPVQYSDAVAKDTLNVVKTPYFIKTNKDYNFEKDNWSVFISEGTFYDDFHLNFDVKDNVLQFENDEIAFKNNVLITYQDSTKSNLENQKFFIASKKDGKLTYNNTKYHENKLKTYTKNTGQFVIVADTIAPNIKSIKKIEGQNISNDNTLRFIITDDISGIKEFNAYLNGKWVLFEYDYKSDIIFYNFDDAMSIEGKNELKIVVTDNVGNSTIFETHFFRSQQK